MSHQFVLVVHDGNVIRAFHRAVLNPADQVEVDRIIQGTLDALAARQTSRPAPVIEARAIPPSSTRMAKEYGYTGSPCHICGSYKVKRNGSCEVCEACGETTGCS